MINHKVNRKIISILSLSLALFIAAIFSKFNVSVINKTFTIIILIIAIVLSLTIFLFYKYEDDKSRISRVLYIIIDYTNTIIFSLAVIFIINLFIIFPKVNGMSMHPTLFDRDIVIVTRHSSIERFDVIVFSIDEEKLHDVPIGENGHLWCKRVIGMPGDRISYVGGELYINDTFYSEDFISSDSDAYHMTVLPGELDNVVIPEGRYLVLGDNRNHSTDSRIIGFVSKELIVGEIKYLINGFKAIKVR